MMNLVLPIAILSGWCAKRLLPLRKTLKLTVEEISEAGILQPGINNVLPAKDPCPFV